MFEDIIKKKKEEEEIIYTNASVMANNRKYNIKVYDVNMTAGTVVGFIKDNTRKIDGYINYEISIPIAGTNCAWDFPVMIVRISPNTLKFYTPGV